MAKGAKQINWTHRHRLFRLFRRSSPMCSQESLQRTPTRLPSHMVRHLKSLTTGRPLLRGRLHSNDLPRTSLSTRPLEPFLRSNHLSRHLPARGVTRSNPVRRASRLRLPCLVLCQSILSRRATTQMRLDERASAELALTEDRLPAPVPAPHTRALVKRADWTSAKEPWASLSLQLLARMYTR